MKYHESMTMKPLVALTLLLGVSAASAATVVERIEVEGADVVRFHLSGPAVGRAIGLPPRPPVMGRIAVDFDDAILGPEVQQPIPGTGVIVQVRPEQVNNGDMVRAMIELTRGVGFAVEHDGNTLTIRLEKPADAAPPDPEKPADAPSAS